MGRDSVFGFNKDMSINDVNSVSDYEFKYADDQMHDLLEVFPSKKDFEGIDKFFIKLNQSFKIQELHLISSEIESAGIGEEFKQRFNDITRLYGICDSITSDSLELLQMDSFSLNRELRKTTNGFNFYWEQQISSDYSELIKNIKLNIKLINEDLGVITAKIYFCDSNIDVTDNTVSEETLLESDLLDEDEHTIYENEANYEEKSELDIKEKSVIVEDLLKVDEVSENQTEINANADNDSKNKQEINYTENEVKKKFSINILNLIWYALMLTVWILFLREPIVRTFVDKQKDSWINIVYYVVFFGYTVVACCLPYIIKSHLNKFASTEERERAALLNGQDFNTKEHKLWSAYRNTFFKKDFGITNKTRASADLYFNYESVANTMMPGFPVAGTFKLIAGSFMGLGILGTFIGFAIGLRNIDFSSTNTTVMLNGIEALVKNGLATAFNTSIVGVFCSLIYNFLIYNPLILKLNKYFEELSDSLDQDFYVSETEALMQYTMLTDENAQNITFSQSLRFIVENMNKQTDALNNFNDSLADKIANMNESVNTALGKIATGVGTEVKDAVLENVHLEMDGLKLSLSDAAKQLGMVAERIENTPELLGKANEELKNYLEDTRSSFTDMLTQNLDANRIALNEVVSTIQTELTDQFKEFSSSLTKALNSSQKAAQLLDNIPAKIEQVESSFTAQEADVAGRFESAASKLEEVSTSVNGYLESVESGITGILNDLTSAEENIKELLASAKMNEDNSGKNLNAVIDETNRMLDGFKAVDINLKNIFESIGNEIVKYNTTVDTTLKQYLSSFEDGSKSFSTAINGSMQEFEDTLNDLSTSIADVQQTSKSFDDSISKLSEILSRESSNKQQDNK